MSNEHETETCKEKDACSDIKKVSISSKTGCESLFIVGVRCWLDG